MKTYALIALTVFALGTVARADSELDGRGKAPAVIVSQLNPVTHTVTNYQVPSPTAQVSPDALDKLTVAERNARVEGFLKQVVRPENKISEEKAQKVSSELDNTGSTSATHWRWRGYNTGYYFGYSYYGYYNNYRYYYQPRWTYANYYYNRGGYYNYYPYYNDCYYTTYSYDGYNDYGW